MRNTQKVQKSKIEQLKLISNSGYDEDNIQMMFKIVDGKTHIHLEPKKKILINGEEKNQLIIDEPTIEKALRKFMEISNFQFDKVKTSNGKILNIDDISLPIEYFPQRKIIAKDLTFKVDILNGDEKSFQDIVKINDGENVYDLRVYKLLNNKQRREIKEYFENNKNAKKYFSENELKNIFQEDYFYNYRKPTDEMNPINMYEINEESTINKLLFSSRILNHLTTKLEYEIMKKAVVDYIKDIDKNIYNLNNKQKFFDLMQEGDNKDKLKEIIISNFENGKSDNLSLKEVRKKILKDFSESFNEDFTGSHHRKSMIKVLKSFIKFNIMESEFNKKLEEKIYDLKDTYDNYKNIALNKIQILMNKRPQFDMDEILNIESNQKYKINLNDNNVVINSNEKIVTENMLKILKNSNNNLVSVENSNNGDGILNLTIRLDKKELTNILNKKDDFKMLNIINKEDYKGINLKKAPKAF